MTHEEIMNLGVEEIENRCAEIKELIDKNEEGTDFEALSAELDSIKERRSVLAKEQYKEDLNAVLSGEGEVRNDITRCR